MVGCDGGKGEPVPAAPQLHGEMTVSWCAVLVQDQGQHPGRSPSCFVLLLPCMCVSSASRALVFPLPLLCHFPY